jgi:hypothetical protein
MTEKTFFDFLNNIFYKRGLEYNKKICSTFHLGMWLSHDKKLIDIVNDINPYQFLIPENIIYRYFYEKVPIGSRYIKWVKKDETTKSEKTEQIRSDMGLSKKEFDHYKPFTKQENNDKIVEKKKKSVTKENASKIFLKG